MKTVSQLIRSISLCMLLAMFSFALPVHASGASAYISAYGVLTRLNFAYDAPSVPAFGYDSASSPTTNERESQLGGGGSNFAAFAGLFAAEEAPLLGGAYSDVEAGLGQVHHMPAKSVSTLSTGDGPSIWMETADHLQTASHGSQGLAGAEYRAQQAALIEQGKFGEAPQTLMMSGLNLAPSMTRVSTKCLSIIERYRLGSLSCADGLMYGTHF